MDQAATFQDPMLSPRPKGKNPMRRYIFGVGIILLLAGVIFGATRLLGGEQTQDVKQAATTPTPTEFQFPTDTPAPTEAVTPTKSVTPTNVVSPKPSGNPIDKATGLDRSNLSVAVQNGSGQVGAASKASETLKSFGYKVASVGNADHFNYEGTAILVKPAFSKYLSLLKADLSGSYSISSTSANLATGSADALVIVGK